MKKISIVIALLASFTSVFAGGPWTQKKGQGFYKLSEWWVVFDQHYTDAGLIDPNVTTGIFNTTFYGEYGVTDRFTGIVNAAVFSRNYMNNLVSLTTNEVLVPGEAFNSIGDIDVAFKYGLTKPGSKIPVAATVLLGIPTGNPSAGSQGNLQTGDGEFNQMLQLDAGTGFKLTNKISSYTSTYVGLNNRTNGFSEEIRYGLELGFGLLSNRIWLTGRLVGVESLKNGDTAETVTSTSIFANNTEFLSYAAEISVYATKRVGFSASVASVIRAEIIAAAPSYSVGVFCDLSK